ncbi:MAG TPA: S46 family peptidase [Calditrichaeota bacterium]|nr:S46 family peptidase [Calditrichota bacterium]
MRRVIFGLMLILFSIMQLAADEGMWLLTQIKDLDLQKEGLEISPEDIYNPDGISITDAIVWLGGCSASFVSPDGLVLTNHHCAYGALQRASSQSGKDYIKSGFLAKDRSEELQAIGSNAYVLQEMTDVTEEVLKAAAGIEDPVERAKKIEEKTAEMVDEIEGDREDVYARISSMYAGKQYIQYVYKKYQDVRIVFAPPASIGKYGGDIDNWMWPRHTGDFTYLRVYMAPDGSGAKYNPENIPVKPKNYLRIADRPLKDGDFSYILGFPGRTNRWRTSYSVQWTLEHNYKPRIKQFNEIIDLMDELGKDNPQAAIKMAGFRSGLANAMKNYQGNVDGMRKTNFVQKKKDFEAQLLKFINSKKELKEKYGHILEQIGQMYAGLEKNWEKDEALSGFGWLSGLYSSIAGQAYSIARERAKPEEEREPGFSERRIKQNLERLKYRYLSFYEPLDKELFRRTLEKALALKGNNRLGALEELLNGQKVEEFVDNAYKDSKLGDPEYAKSLYKKSVEELEKIDDPFIKLAKALYDQKEELKEQNEEFSAKITELRKQYINALLAWKGSGLYPDANGTIRFTYGHVAGYKPRDAVWYEPFTTLAGVIEKNTGKEPFDMPDKLQKLHEKKDFGKWAAPELKDVPVAFLNRCDITGGNSGSAVMNGKGQLIGLAFDGNYEAMTSDWQYDYDMQRTIAVDIRYVMFITEKFAGADYLLKEMGLK